MGLQKINHSVFHKVNPSSAGWILKVKEIIKVEVVNRKKPRGFKVIGKMAGVGPLEV